MKFASVLWSENPPIYTILQGGSLNKKLAAIAAGAVEGRRSYGAGKRLPLTRVNSEDEVAEKILRQSRH